MKLRLVMVGLLASVGSSDPSVRCQWGWYNTPVSPDCRVNLSCSTKCDNPSQQHLDCHTEINENCLEEEGDGECETVNMMECQEELLCQDVSADCDEAEAVEEAGEECQEEVREECVPITEEVCTSLQVMECQERTEDDCTKCGEVMEEVEVPCEREQEVCQEISKPVCTVNRINCTETAGESDEETAIVFTTNLEGRQSMTFSRLIENLQLEEDFEIDVDPPVEPTLVITRDIVNNIVDVEMEGLGGRSGCLVVK